MGTDKLLRQSANILGVTFDDPCRENCNTLGLQILQNQIQCEGCNGIYLETGGLIRRMEAIALSGSAQYQY